MLSIRRALGWLGIVTAAVVGLGGIYVVPQDEIGVVRRFGAVLPEPRTPGLHWGLPWGLDRLDRIKPNQARTLTVGTSMLADGESGEFLTGDRNLIRFEALVQYRVRETTAYLFATASAEQALRRAVESALAEAAAARDVDSLLTNGRSEFAERVRQGTQDRADAWGLGVSIRAVRLGRVAPPAAVAAAFSDADRARSERQQFVNRAEEYRGQAQAEAQAMARERLDRAESEHVRTVEKAKGEAARFRALRTEVAASPTSARNRMYLEMLAEVLPSFRRTVVLNAGQDLDVTLDALDARGEAVPTRSEP